MNDRIVLRRQPGQVEVVVVRAGRLLDYALWRPGAPDGWGDLHRGRVTRRIPSLGGAFVALEGQADGFLADGEMNGRVSEGDIVAVRITRAAQGGKGPRLTGRLEERIDAGPPGLVRRGPSPLEELRDRHAGVGVWSADAAVAAAMADVRWSADEAALDDAIEEGIDGLAQAALPLPGGALATITPTPALVAIDVDGAAATEGRAGKQAAQFAVNRDLLPRLLHELRLRNLSGAILIDLAGLKATKRSLLRPVVEAALGEDPLRPRLVGFTGLGLIEIVRARRRPPLHELGDGAAGAAYAAARSLAQACAAQPGARLALRVPAAVARAIEADAVIGRDLARATGHALMLRADASLQLGWTIEEVSA